MFKNRRYLLHALVVFVVAVAAVQSAVAADVVSMTVDFGNGTQKKFDQLPWKAGLTVLDAARLAEKQPRGIRIKSRGKGDTAFVFQIDDTANEGRGRNWIYRVNGKLADRSVGVYKLNAGDNVSWRFRSGLGTDE